MKYGCCSANSCCCNSQQQGRSLVIDFLYLDLSTCERCIGTEKNLDEAIKEVSTVLKAAGYNIVVNRVNIKNKELAYQYEFLSSPTIRVNGRDIALEVKESACKDCGDICGDNVDCRVWSYEGADYTEPPKALIINAILKEVYAAEGGPCVEKSEYKLPQNLALFFEGLTKLKKDK